MTSPSQNNGDLVLTNVFLETVWTSGTALPGPPPNTNTYDYVPTNSAYASPTFSIVNSAYVYVPPTAPEVTVVPQAGSIVWPLGSVVQCLLQNGSLGTAYLSIPTSATTVRDARKATALIPHFITI